MAPQGYIPPAANALGTIGTVFWCVQLIPQIWSNWRRKQTDGVPHTMMLLWAICAVPFGVYAIVQNFNIPIQIQPQVFGVLAIINWCQILLYSHAWRIRSVVILGFCTALVFGGLEVLLILTLRPVYDRGTEWPVLIVGIVAAIFLVAGLVPPYMELIHRRGRVLGINFVFLTMDWLGAFFSLLSVVLQVTFDTLGGILYALCIALEAGIFISHGIFLFRTRKLRKEAKALGIKFDDMPEARKYQRAGVDRRPDPEEATAASQSTTPSLLQDAKFLQGDLDSRVISSVATATVPATVEQKPFVNPRKP